MSEIYGREAEKQRLSRIITRYCGGVLGYYGMSGLGKSTLLDAYERQLRDLKFTPYIVWLNFADASLHDPVAAFIELIDQLEATGATRERKGILGRGLTDSPLNAAMQALTPQLSLKQIIKVHATGGSVVEHIANNAQVQTSISQAQLNDAVGKFKQGIAKLPQKPPIPKGHSSIHRPLVVVMVDTLELAPTSVLNWVKQLATPMFQEYLLLIAVGQEKIEGLLETLLDRVEDSAIKNILADRFNLTHPQTIGAICQLARGIPRCAVLAGDLLQQDSALDLQTLIPDTLNDHLVADYLVRHILRRLPDSSTDKHLLTYGCVLHRWESTEQLRVVLHGVPQVRDILGIGADIGAALERLRQRSFLDSGHPHATLRDLLLHDLQQDEKTIYSQLHHSAANYFVQQKRPNDAVYHFLAIADWQSVINLWDSAIKDKDISFVGQILSELSGQTVPQEQAFDVQILLVESGLLLRNAAHTRIVLTLLDSDLTPEQSQTVRQLAQSVHDADFAPAELRYRLRLKLTEDPAEQAAALNELGAILLTQAYYSEARAVYSQAQVLYEALGDQQGQAAALRGLGQVLLRQARYEEAGAAYSQAQVLYDEIGDRQGHASCLRGLGEVLLRQANYEEAGAAYSQAQVLYDGIGDRQGQADALCGLGRVMVRQANYEEAKVLYSQAQALSEGIGDRRGQADALFGLGKVMVRQARYEEAEALYNQVQLYIGIGDSHRQAGTLLAIGHLLLIQGRYGEAQTIAKQAQALYEALGDQQGQAHVLFGLGNLLDIQARYGEAWEVYSRAQTLYEGFGDRYGQVQALLGLGGLLVKQVRYGEAWAAYSQAQALSSEIGDRSGQAQTLLGLGNLLVKYERYMEACEAYSQAQTMYEGFGDWRGQADALIGMVEVAVNQGDNQQGWQHLNQLESLLMHTPSAEFRHQLSQSVQTLRARLLLLQEGAEESGDET